MPLEPGATFGRYKLDELLGRGGMGEVYSAYDSVLHRKVALKALTVRPNADRAGPVSSSDGASRILREARAAAGISHPNAVAIYDVGEVDGVPFLAMELVSGRTLRSFIGDASVPVGRRIRWIADVARALGAAHQLGLVHRDIKPENVMVSDEGFVKVLDFGIARRAAAKGEAAAPSNPMDLTALAAFAVSSGTLTAEGLVIGTPMYMAPEQVRAGAIDGRTDQFAWGVLAFEVLTGRTPWEGEGIAIFSQILAREVDWLGSRAPEVPAGVDAIVRKAMNKAPDARFATMEEIAEELEPFAATGAAMTTGGLRIAIPVGEMVLAETEQASAAAVRSGVASGGTARTEVVGGDERGGRTKRGRAAITVAAVVGAAVIGVFGVRGRIGARGTTQGGVDAGDVDVPSQMSTNAEATAAYRAGMEALRNGSSSAARSQFSRAIQLDPLFGAAQLRLPLTKLLSIQEPTITSADLQGAHASQASLGTRDRILLNAFELITRQPPDYSKGRQMLEAAGERYPADADFPFELGLLLDVASQPAEATKAFDASLKRDRSFAFAWRMKAVAQIEMGDDVDGTQALTECMTVSAGATTCLWDLATIQVNGGKCRAAAATARDLIQLAPESHRPNYRLAEGLIGSGEPEDAVRTSLKPFLDSMVEPERSEQATFFEASLAILKGNFSSAEEQYDHLGDLHEAREASIFDATYPRILLDVEIGRSARALDLAERYLRQRAGLAPNHGPDSLLMVETAERAAGGLSRKAFATARDAWLSQHPDMSPEDRWLEAYARPAETPDDASAAMALAPKEPPLFSLLQILPRAAEPIGRTLVLAGRPEEGIAYLRLASSSCALLDGENAIYSTWATLELGRALESRGDVASACTAYERVLRRWGIVRPPSRTAAEARGRRRALGCRP